MDSITKPAVELSYHRTNWIFEYTEEVKKLKTIIPSKINCCFMHVGSTAAHSVTARPIIDLAVGVINSLDLITVRDILVLKGYKFLESRSTIFDLLLEKKYEGKSSFLIHVVTFDGAKWKDMYDFTQYLKSNLNAAKEYSAFKTNLLLKNKVSKAEYEKQKAKYINEMLKAIRKQ